MNPSKPTHLHLDTYLTEITHMTLKYLPTNFLRSKESAGLESSILMVNPAIADGLPKPCTHLRRKTVENKGARGREDRVVGIK